MFLRLKELSPRVEQNPSGKVINSCCFLACERFSPFLMLRAFSLRSLHPFLPSFIPSVIPSFLSFFFRFIEDFFQKPGVILTEEQIRIYEEDLYMSNLPEKEVYISQLKAAGFTDIQVCQFV